MRQRHRHKRAYAGQLSASNERRKSYGATHIDIYAFSTSIHAAMVYTSRIEATYHQRGSDKLHAERCCCHQVHSKSNLNVGFTCAARSQGLGRGFILLSAMAWSGLGGLSLMSLIPGMGCPCQTAAHTELMNRLSSVMCTAAVTSSRISSHVQTSRLWHCYRQR